MLEATPFGNFYHVMSQGINKEPIFQTNLYKEKYKKIIKEKLENSNVNIISYSIMSNHVHLLFNSENISNISKFMQKVNTAYSIFYNRNNKRVGYVFRNRFLSKSIMNMPQLFVCIKYIHSNPVEAGITQEYSAYEYSSYNEFFGKKEIINDGCVEKLFSTREEYRDYFYKIHNSVEEDSAANVIDKINNYIVEIQKKYNIDIKQVKNNKKLLRKILQDMEGSALTTRTLAEIYDVSKSTISNYRKQVK